MRVADLILALQKLPQDAEVRVPAPDGHAYHTCPVAVWVTDGEEYPDDSGASKDCVIIGEGSMFR